jgi:hypothetical protein
MIFVPPSTIKGYEVVSAGWRISSENLFITCSLCSFRHPGITKPRTNKGMSLFIQLRVLIRKNEVNNFADEFQTPPRDSSPIVLLIFLDAPILIGAGCHQMRFLDNVYLYYHKTDI